MALSIGIVGLPNVGKSTLFNALTNNNVLAANYPFATIEPNTGVVPIPDPRLNELAKIYNTERIVPATVTFVDIAGLVKGASEGQGLGNQFLSHIRSCSAICEVVRVFEDKDVQHVAEQINPTEDISVITTELVLADIQTVQNRLTRMEKEVKADSKLKPVLDTLSAALALLNEGKPLFSSELLRDSYELIADLQLLTAKPIIYLFNVDEKHLSDNEYLNSLANKVRPAKALFVCAKLEEQLKDLDELDARELLASYGANESGLNKVIHAAYDTLGLQSFLTAGEKEVRAWTIKKGSTAPEAAGVIHSDFQRGFIAAQVVTYDDLISAGSLVNARSQGKVRTEGKDYIMKPDDVVEFRFNVSK